VAGVADSHAVARDQPAEVARAPVELGLDRVGPGERRQQRLALRLQPLDLGGALGRLDRLELLRERDADLAAGLPRLVGDEVGRAVVAGEHAPEPVADDHGDDHRRRHAHVLEVLDVDRRHAAQRAVAHVERSLCFAAHQRQRFVGDVRDDADMVAQVERARLDRDVARRVVVVDEARQVRGAAFRCDLAGAVGQELVGHDAVEAGDRGDLVGCPLARGHLPVRRLDARDGGAEAGEHAGGRRAVVERGLELKYHPARALVGEDVELARAAVEPERAEEERFAPRREARCLGERRQRLPDGVLETTADRRPAEADELVEAARRLDDGLVGRVDDEQHAVRLDRTRKVDRFPIASRQIHAAPQPEMRADVGRAPLPSPGGNRAGWVFRRTANIRCGGVGLGRGGCRVSRGWGAQSTGKCKAPARPAP